jgi:hypothetical protein
MSALRISSATLLAALVAGCSGGAGVGDASVSECRTPRLECGRDCVSPISDPAHCGSCGHACEPGQYCSAGVCSEGCTGALTACGFSCVDPVTDAAHCGRCGRSCWPGASCVQGACVVVQGTGGTSGGDGTSGGGASGTGDTPNDARIRVSGGEFRKCGRRIFMNGANTPWNNWNDFGGNYDESWWSAHYRELREAGLNSSRVWLTCSGEVGIDIDSDGTVHGATPAHWQDLDSLFRIAEQQRIHVLATLMSFDHFRQPFAARWQAWILSDQAIDSYVNNYLIPLLERYRDSPYLWAIDLMNEPDWAYERSNIPLHRLRAYFARAARAIHENSEVLVTIGVAMPKYVGLCSGCEHSFADAELRGAVDDPDAYLDFYSPHYYDWMGELWGNVVYSTPGLSGFPTDKPLLLGEHPARGTSGHTLTEDLKAALAYGWQGTLPWTSNGVDANGGFSEVSSASSAFSDAHPSLVFPACE